MAFEDIPDFETKMGQLSDLSKKVGLEEKYDWLTYTTDSNKYLIVNFSNGLSDVLGVDSYRKAFQNIEKAEEFDNIIGDLQQLDIQVERNYVIQMLLPWSTVEEISVSEFPLATMIEYNVPINKIESFDTAIGTLADLLKKTKYPYPLESNRGSIGGYGTVAFVWFYDNRNDFFGKNNLLQWMKEHKRMEKFQSIMEIMEKTYRSKNTYNFDYQKALSY